MKKKTIVLFGIILIFTIALAYYAVAQNNYYYNEEQLILECPVTIPNAYLQKIDLLGAFIDGDEKSEGYTILKIDFKQIDPEQTQDVIEVWNELCQYVTNLESSTLGNNPIFFGFTVPFACPKDSLTQIKSGLYLEAGKVISIPNDPLCP